VTDVLPSTYRSVPGADVFNAFVASTGGADSLASNAVQFCVYASNDDFTEFADRVEAVHAGLGAKFTAMCEQYATYTAPAARSPVSPEP